MAQKTKIGGTAYTITHGRAKVGGTAYDIDRGKTKIGGTAKDILFGAVPSQYQQVEYLAVTQEGKKGPYILLPITTQEGLELHVTVNKYLGKGWTNNICYLGYYASGNKEQTFFLNSNSALLTPYMKIAGNDVTPASYRNVANGTTITFALQFGNGANSTASVTSSSIWSEATQTRSRALAATGNPMYLFTQKAQRAELGRFGQVTAYNSAGAMIMDIYPCYRKSDGEAGYWDRVSKQFLTDASGYTSLVFEVGPDV